MSTEPTLVALDRTALEAKRQGWLEAKAQLESYACASSEQKTWWAARLTEVQAAIRALEDEREVLIRPILTDQKLVNEAFRAAAVPANEVKDLIKSKIGAFDLAVLQEQEAARRLAAQNAQAALKLQEDARRLAAEASTPETRLVAHTAAVDAQLATAAVTTALAAAPAMTYAPGSSTTYTWDFEVTDDSAVPDIYKIVDEKAIRAVAKAYAKRTEAPKIPGVLFTRKANVAARGGR